MRASQLAALMPGSSLSGADCDIAGLTSDSRTMRPGGTFIALRGSLTDGHRFIDSAIQKGAGLIIAEQGKAPQGVRPSVLSVNRVDYAGRLLYTFPDEQSAGRAISNQPHVRTILATHQSVVSEVFNSVQGFRCVALHVPVFDGEQFAGSLDRKSAG